MKDHTDCSTDALEESHASCLDMKAQINMQNSTYDYKLLNFEDSQDSLIAKHPDRESLFS